MTLKIFVTRRLPDEAMQFMEEHFELRCNPEDRVLTRKEILEGTKWCDILLCLLTDTIDAKILRVNPNLKAVINYAVGFNNIDIEEANRLKIPVTNTPGVLTETTADMAWALMFAVGRRVVESDRYVRDGKFTAWSPLLMLGGDIHGKTLGIVGAGRIGAAVARRSTGFGMKVLYCDDNVNHDMETECEAVRVKLSELLKVSDFVSLHVPLSPDTYHLISKAELQMMKPTAYLINTARGAVVNEIDLLEALQDKIIAGAGLDVFEHEPELTSGLTELDNVVLAPHIASASNDTRTKMALMAADNAIAVKDKHTPPNLVNPEILNGEYKLSQ